MHNTDRCAWRCAFLPSVSRSSDTVWNYEWNYANGGSFAWNYAYFVVLCMVLCIKKKFGIMHSLFNS